MAQKMTIIEVAAEVDEVEARDRAKKELEIKINMRQSWLYLMQIHPHPNLSPCIVYHQIHF